MASRIQFPAYLSNTASLPDYNAPYAIRVKVRLVNNTGSYSHFVAICGTATETEGDYVDSDFLGTGSDGLTLRIGAYDTANGGGTDGNGTTLSTGVDYDLMLVRESASVLKCYLDGVLDITVNRDISGRVAAPVAGLFLGRFNGGYPMDGRLSHYIEWLTSKTAAEAASQVHQVAPVSLVGLNRHTKMFKGAGERVFDEVRGLNWTESGTITDEDGPNIALLGRPKRRVFQTAGGGGGSATGTGTPSTSIATASGTGIASHGGSGAPATSLATASGAGKDSPRGTGTPSTSIATASGSGVASHRGTGSPSTSVATASGAGADGRIGAGAFSTSLATAAGSGVASHRGSGAPSTFIPTVAGTGSDSPRGTGAPSTTAPTAVGTGIASHRGTGAPSTSVATGTGSGANGKSGTGATATSVATAAGSGIASHAGAGAPSTTLPTAAGAGSDAPRGSGAPSTAVATASGTGVAAHLGSGAPSTSIPTASGAAVASHRGSGAPSTSVPTSAGVGAAGVGGGSATGSGAATVPHVTCSGVGVVTGIYVNIFDGIEDLAEGQEELVESMGVLRVDLADMKKLLKTILSDQTLMQQQIKKGKQNANS